MLLCVCFAALFMSCVRKHAFEKYGKELQEEEMVKVMADIFLMEAYVDEKWSKVSKDSVAAMKKSLYPPILKHHQIDSTVFFTTFNYYQSHPEEFIVLLKKVEAELYAVKPTDTTTVVVSEEAIAPPEGLEDLPGFKQQEAAMREQFIKAKEKKGVINRKNQSGNKQE